MIPALTLFLALLADQTEDDALASLSTEEYQALLEHAQQLREPVDWARTFVSRHHPLAARYYAEVIDRGPHDETRIGASRSPEHALIYALEIDKAPHPVTRRGVMQPDLDAIAKEGHDSRKWAYRYMNEVDCGPRPDLRAWLLQGNDAAQKAVHIAKFVDQRILPETEAAARGTPYEDWLAEFANVGVRIDPRSAEDLAVLKSEITRLIRRRVLLGRMSQKSVQTLSKQRDVLARFVDQAQRARRVARELGLESAGRVLVIVSEGPVFRKDTYTHLTSMHLSRPLIPIRPVILELRGDEVRFDPEHLQQISEFSNARDLEVNTWIRLPLGRLPHVDNWTRLDVVESIHAGEFP
jgi:hypothetical protein